MIDKFNRLYIELLQGRKNTLSLTESDLTSMKLDTSIISEDVFREDVFLKLFNYLKELDDDKIVMSPKQLSDFFPVKSKIRKKLSKTYFNKNFYVSLIDMNSVDDIIDHIVWWTKLPESSKTVKQITDEIWNAFSDATALFFSNFDKGMLLLKRDEFTVNDLKHEFIHYYRWCTGDDSDEMFDVSSVISKHEKSVINYNVNRMKTHIFSVLCE